MKKLSLILVLTVLLVVGCKKRKEKNIQSSKDFALIANNISTVLPLVVGISANEDGLNAILNNGSDSLNTYASITLISGDTLDVSNSSPLVIDIDFQSGVEDKDNIFKKGTIRCTIYGYMSSVGANCSCSFDEFEIGGNVISGGIAIANSGNNSYLLTTSNLSLQVGKRTIYYDSETRMKQVSGLSTADNILDNDYQIYLSAVLEDRYGKEFEVYAEELIKEYNCKWLIGGFAELNETEKNKSQVIDFGDGACDNEAVVTIDEKVYTVEL